MIKSISLAFAVVAFTIACNVANAAPDNGPRGTVTVGAPTVVSR